jgi:hypothetical protein
MIQFVQHFLAQITIEVARCSAVSGYAGEDGQPPP